MAEDYKRAGWYPAPDGDSGERWWNGASWSDSRRGQAAAAPPTPLPPSVVYSAGNPAPQRPDPYAAPVFFGSTPLVKVDARNNRMATAGLVTGAIGVFGFSIISPVAIVLSFLGIKKARELKAQGQPSSSLILGVIGVGLGVIGTVQLVIAIIAFITTIAFDVTLD